MRSPIIAAPSGAVKLDGFEAWVVRNSGLLALGVVVVAFAVGLACADCSYLNPDEAMHFDVASPRTWLGAYEGSRKVSHPPLFILVLHGMLFIGRTELILRLPSLVSGTAALWVTFAWLRRSLGALPGLAGLGFMALSHMGISASTEVRQYGLLLFFVCSSLYATERALTERSVFWTIAQGILLLGALLTHYTAVVVILALPLYVLVRALVEGVPRRILLTFGMDYVVLATLFVWLYFTHIRRAIRGPSASINMYHLRPYYYIPASETLLGFVHRSLTGTFSYAVGAHRLPFLSMLVFLAGLTALLTGRTKSRRLMALLVGCPFAVGFAAAIAEVFPFAGSRHQMYLLPFLAAGIAASLAWLPRGVSAPLLLLTGAIVTPLWANRPAPDNDCRVTPKRDMTEAIGYVSKTIPRGSPLIADYQTRALLRYYLAANDTNFVGEHLGDYLVPVSRTFDFRADEVFDQVMESARVLGLPPGETLWVVSAGWVDPNLSLRFSGGNCSVKKFGRISVIRILNWDQAQTAPPPK
jgi:hypothetical protein